MEHPGAFWGSVLAFLVVVDLWADGNEREGDTFSECTRALFHVDTTKGKAAFTLAWGGLGLWYWQHITRPQPFKETL